MNKVKIIAEIGCNHNGNVDIAKQMVDYLISINVDAIKFQIFNAKNLISKYAPKAEYQKNTTDPNESQLEMTEKLELGKDDYINLVNYIKTKNNDIEVFATAFDLDSIDFLRSIGQKIWKIPSGEINNYPYIEKLSNFNEPDNVFLISTGMSTIDEIKQSIKLLKSNGISDKQIIVFQCNTEYPTPYSDVNLNVLNSFKKIFSKNKLGFSDHSEGPYAAIASVPYGVAYIEKHFTLDKNMDGPDHIASLNPQEMFELVNGVRAATMSLGSSDKLVTSSEAKNLHIARKSIVAKRDIKKGEKFTTENITTKRPGNGISSWHWKKVLGTTSEFDFSEDELIRSSKIKWEEDK